MLTAEEIEAVFRRHMDAIVPNLCNKAWSVRAIKHTAAEDEDGKVISCKPYHIAHIDVHYWFPEPERALVANSSIIQRWFTRAEVASSAKYAVKDLCDFLGIEYVAP